MGLIKKQIEFLDKFTKGKWALNEKTGLVDIEGDFDCSRNKIERNYYGGVKALSDFKEVKFGVVTGNFYCVHNTIKSLKGSPQRVGGNFDCSHNKLTSLEGAPQEIVGNFNCLYNKIISIKGAPQEIGGDFFCSSNKITSLEGSPQRVRRLFGCSNNNLTSLVGGPQEVDDFDCGSNPLTSLMGAPQVVSGYFSCMNTKLTSLEGAPLEWKGNYSNFYRNPISEDTINLVWKTMRKNKIDYRTALISLKGEIPAKDWKKMSSALKGDI